MPGDTIVRMNKICKSFPGVKALNNVDFELKQGEVHVLLGENGAGKSTLMKILGGVYSKDSGEIFYNNAEVHFHNVAQAIKHGINIIYQELNLVENLTVAENIFLGKEIRSNGIINWKKMYEESQKYLNQLDLSFSSKRKIYDLGIAEQQMVEVAHALSKKSKVIVMDEPTSALTDREIKKLFEVIEKLKENGVGIVYISHRLQEILEIGDRITVLRDGELVHTGEIRNSNNELTTDLGGLIKMMVGRELKNLFPKEKASIGEEKFRAENFSTQDKLKQCSFSVRSGEILGIAGLMGAGRTELARAIIGADSKISGDVYIDGKKIKINSPKVAVKNKIGYLPEDRKGSGLVLGLDVNKNLTLCNLKKIIKGLILNLRQEKVYSQEMVDKLKIKTPSLKQKVKNLSGGNQQKVVIGKWLYTDSEVLIFDEPTRGIDVGAKVEIYKLMVQLAKEGKSIVMISSELPEILGMSDRIIVMHEGMTVGELSHEEATQDRILEYAIGHKDNARTIH